MLRATLLFYLQMRHVTTSVTTSESTKTTLIKSGTIRDHFTEISRALMLAGSAQHAPKGIKRS